MSEKLKTDLRRLRLKEGDIVLVRNPLTLEALMRVEMPEGTPSCPIVYAPEGVHRLSKDYLRRLLT
jgi:hypothetical protein